MPELPDVQVFGEELDRRGLGHRIASVTVPEPAILEGTTPQGLGRRLRGRTLESSRRHGKNLFGKISDGGGWIRMHFGMTGRLVVHGGDDEEPRHVRLRIDFTDGDHLDFTNQRKLGRIAWVRDVDAWVEEHRLGPDAGEIDLETFRERLRGRRTTVKAALMDQSVLAGLGNVYTDETLFQMKLHPSTPVQDLDDDDLEVLHRTMHEVLRRAIEARVENFPRNFLVPHRSKGETCPRCGAALERIEVAGRGTFVCPREQPEPG